ncbi:MAG: outer membrane beta-barrel domain-containing protein [Bdellovibrionales bacterium]|nr:outer membrane beta-barrel domain-containing protein [Bdellovibrionales bacterium]
MSTKIFSLVSVMALGLAAVQAKAETTPSSAPAQPSLEDQLSTLSLPPNEAPLPMSSEKLYSVQTRFVDPTLRLEVSANGGTRLSGDSFLRSQEVGGSLRFYVTDRIYLQGAYAKVYNQLTSTGKQFLADENRLPDSAYASQRVDGMLGYNLFYGKFRLSMNSTMYFDHYISLGGGSVQMATGWTPSYVGETGLQLWAGKNMTFRLGIKDYFYKETRLLSSSYEHNITGLISVGWIFGGGRS